MESLAQALNIGIPLFLILIAIEFLYGYFTHNQTLNLPDTVSSLSSGITNITKSVLGLIVAIVSYDWIERNFAIFNLEVKWWMFPVVFIAKDFSGYWIHRFEHKVNYFWNRHIIHHSSEEFNLPCALRQSISEIFSFGIFFVFPLAFLGIPSEVFAIVAPIHLFAQFWYHTRHINKMGKVLEYVIVTPSHHRVHHAINDIYLDKNFSQIFIFWDRIFGTFQEELENEPCVYGVKRQVNTWNPIIINFQHAFLVWKDFILTRSWKDKFKIWFMPTGWRPADREATNPIDYIKDPFTQVKYQPFIKVWVQAWSLIQTTVTVIIALVLFNHISLIPFYQALLVGAFIFLEVYSYTTIMDGKKHGAVLEIIKSIIGIVGIYYFTQNLILESWVSSLLIAIAVYYGVCILLSAYYLVDKTAKVETIV
ncbi:MAG: sterol desaturase family protein [Bacteroidetes bacterium]|nr:sterol desaturase family protein [Bacteroidota bacterium]MCB9226016.1 sterol desaturase family protein [Chitinophagales bacterium]